MQDLNLLEIVIQNKEWVFSGIGVFVLALFIKSKTNNSNSVKVKNTVINGDFTGRDRK